MGKRVINVVVLTTKAKPKCSISPGLQLIERYSGGTPKLGAQVVVRLVLQHFELICIS